MINPFHRSTRPGSLEVIDHDNHDSYDADGSSDTDNEVPPRPALPSGAIHYKYGWPVTNPLEQIASGLDNVLFQLINNTPQYKSTIRRFMDGYKGPEDLEFWMNTLGVEHMNWEVLHEVDRLGLQLPSGWNCLAREFEERRVEANINYPAQYPGGAGTAAAGINSKQQDYSYNGFEFRSERPIPKSTLPGTQTTFSLGQVPTPVPITIASTMPQQIPLANTYRFGV